MVKEVFFSFSLDYQRVVAMHNCCLDVGFRTAATINLNGNFNFVYMHDTLSAFIFQSGCVQRNALYISLSLSLVSKHVPSAHMRIWRNLYDWEKMIYLILEWNLLFAFTNFTYDTSSLQQIRIYNAGSVDFIVVSLLQQRTFSLYFYVSIFISTVSVYVL